MQGTSLIEAVKQGYLHNILLELLDPGADVKIVANQITPFMAAIENQNVGLVSFLLDKGADPNQVTPQGI